MHTHIAITKIIPIIRKIGNILYGLLFGCLLLIATLLVVSTLNITGNYKILMVQSSSMEPSIKKGSVVIATPKSSYQKNDIITFVDPSNKKTSVTHRIVDVEKKDGNTFYITKGDANNANDDTPRPGNAVIGKIMVVIPYVGYPVAFGKTRDGFIFLVIIPTVIIIYNEILAIKNEMKKIIEKRKTAHA